MGVSLCLPSTSVADSADEIAAKAAYEQARVAIEQLNYAGALNRLRSLQKTYPNFSNLAGVKTRIAVLREAHKAGSELGIFLSALDARDDGKPENSLALLQQLIDTSPSSTLLDDAMYLMAYVQLMERFDYASAQAQLSELKRQQPDTAYRDAADYLSAIAYEQSGQTDSAMEQFAELRERHTSVSLPFGYRIARGNVMSRYWFERADRRLKLLAHQRDEASHLTSRRSETDEELHLGVTVAGVEMNLVLFPSTITKTTMWQDGDLDARLPPNIGVLTGHVKGEPNSWVRVVLEKNKIRGVVSIDGQLNQLKPDNLVGTLDYYQPKHRAGVPVKLGGSATELPLLLDTLTAPPLPGAYSVPQSSNRAGDKQALNVGATDMQIVPVSIVIDRQFNRYYSGEALLHALNALNVADAVYRPMGLALQLDHSIVFEEWESDPMAIGPATLEAMLRNFRDFRRAERTQFKDSALVYLFTGNTKTDITLGLAWIDTACRTDGYDVGVTTPSSFADVLLTHELGHSLGAQHDTDTQCSGTVGKLMSPRISAATETAMSACSRRSITKSERRSCLLSAVDLAMSATLDGYTAALNITNNDSNFTVSASVLVEVDQSAEIAWPAECELRVAGSAECQLANLAPNSTRSITIPFISPATPRLSAQLISDEVTDPIPDNNVVTLNIDADRPGAPTLLASNGSSHSSGSQFGTGGQPKASAARGGGAMSWIGLLSLTFLLQLTGRSHQGRRRFQYSH